MLRSLLKTAGGHQRHHLVALIGFSDARRGYETADRVRREAFRALKPGGMLALSNVCAGPAGPPYFPVPWAATPDTSFLATPEATRADLQAAGFTIVSFHDTSDASRQGQLRERDRMEHDGTPPPLGIHLILGDRIREMRLNSVKSQLDDRTRTIEALVRKPG